MTWHMTQPRNCLRSNVFLEQISPEFSTKTESSDDWTNVGFENVRKLSVWLCAINWICASKFYRSLRLLFPEPFTTRICIYILILPQFCLFTQFFSDNFFHVLSRGPKNLFLSSGAAAKPCSVFYYPASTLALNYQRNWRLLPFVIVTLVSK